MKRSAARYDMTDLTPRQRETLNWVKSFIQEHGMPPTVREIGRAFDIKSSSVFDLLQALERKGYLRRGTMGSRSLIIEGRKGIKCGCLDVPVTGLIAAGAPIEAIEEDHGTISVSRELLRGSSGFALKVKGNSMVEASILDGDYVVIRRQETADDGDIVVALIEGEATLKRFYREDGRVRLEPANREIAPIYVEQGDFKVQGKMVGVMRFMAGDTPGGERE
jgi:repressor LexA